MRRVSEHLPSSSQHCQHLSSQVLPLDAGDDYGDGYGCVTILLRGSTFLTSRSLCAVVKIYAAPGRFPP